MLIYRYEMEDGGGPYATYDGHWRFDKPKIPPMDDGRLSGCVSFEKLKEYWNEDSHPKGMTDNCKIKIYNVPTEDVVYTVSHVYFPKKYKSIN